MIPLLSYMLTVFFVLFLHFLLTYNGALLFLAKMNPVKFVKKFWPALVVGFSTSSSNATIPVTQETLTNKLGVSKDLSSFTVPLGATINMDGTAIMQGVATIFLANAYGIELGISSLLMVVVVAVLASIGTAGVPGVGLIMLSMILTQVGIPVEGIGLIWGIDRILDMTRTAVNISGDAICSIIIAKSENDFDQATYDAD